MSVPQKLKGRYEIKEVLGQGGMGLVYRAYDAVVRRDVALKTLRDAPNRAALQMFYKECEVLAALSHPNIVEIFDIGEFEEDGKAKPYFVMPLLPGAPLDKLIRASSHRLTVERVVDILCQTCRGLHAAHERGLVHRDIKPSNLFVMDDDSVKIIDFGVAHLVEAGLSVGAKGTLLYMPPEQLQMKPASPASDVYSLGVVAFEALTRRRAFEGPNENEIVEAVLHRVPPPACDLNPAVSQILSRVVHKAMAKQPWNRYASAREFADTLLKAVRNEPIEFFNPARIQPRIERAAKAFEQGDHQFAAEILAELEAEGHIDPAIAPLRRQIEHAARQKTIGQLLESARTRFEHEEFPLSLQKIQEILQLDPANAQALGLKTSIENRLVSQKIEEWFRLARQHIENQAYSHAREAIRNVLDLKPAEARATQLMAEVDRLEQDYLRARKEKDELYHSALDAWNCGEVTSALGKLERVIEIDGRSPDKSSPDRAAAYQNFYNKVRSEHDSLKNSYDEARKHLGARNFAQAIAIVNDFLGKYPGHALFQALKFDIEEQQRQELSARIAAIDRELEAEPDVDRRVSILEDAVAAYPGEPHFERQLKPMREKRDLVNSIAAKARYHEEQRQFNDALAQWEILRTIYSQYPGLEFEIERVVKRRDQQARTEAKAGWLEQIERAKQSGDHAKAGELAASAEAEFPGDAELAQLKQAAAEAAGHAAEARELLAQGQSLCKQAWFEEGLGAMKRALELDPRSAAIKQALLDQLIERARALIDTDLPAAEPLIQQALDVDPNNALAKSLRTTALDHKRDQVVVQAFTEARQLRAAGDLEAALRETEQCLSIYPLEPRLAQLRDVLTKELDEARRKKGRTGDLEEIRKLAGETAGAPHPDKLREALARAQEIADRYPGDAEFHAAVTDIAQRLSAAFAAAEAAKPAEAPPAAPPPAAKQPAAKQPAAKPAAAAPKPAAPKPAAPPKPPAKRAAKRSKALVIGGIAAALVILLAAGAFFASRKRPQAAGALQVDVRTTPPGAVIRVDGKIRGTSNFKLEIAPGTYQIEASLDGYAPASASVAVGPQSIAPVEFTFQPLPQTVRVITDLTDGKAALDDQPARDLQEGQLVFDAVPPGKHSVKLSSRGGEAAFTFELATGAAPVVSGPPAAKNFSAVLVTSFGTRARLYSTMLPAKAELDGAPAGEVGAEGLLLEKLPAGQHELALSDGKTQLKKIIETGAAPMLTAFIQSDQNIGTLVILAGQDGADVYIDGKKYRRQTARGGQLRISREPRQYRVRVAKDGFQDAPEQVVQIQKGEEKKIVFDLAPMPTTARLVLQGAPAGAQVVVDQNAIGAVGADGSFEYAGVAPGERSIELRNGKMRSKPVRRNFSAGQEVRLAAADVAMRSTGGTLKVAVSPASAQVTVVRAGGQPQPVIGGSIELDEGSYTVTARAQGYVLRSERVQVTAGQPASVDLTLSRERAAMVAHGMEDWENPKEWTADGEWFVHKGEGLILYKPMPGAGSYAFNIIMTRGKNIEWIIDYKDGRNYALFRLDKDNFRRIVSVNGKKTEMVKKPHGLDMKDYLMASVQIELTPDAVIQRVQKNGQWMILDNWAVPDRKTAEGRFGVSVSGGRDEVRISGFGFYPKE